MDVKKLYTKRKVIKQDLDILNDELYTKTRQQELKMQELRKIDKQLEKAQKGELIITEHAILRYMERVKFLNLEDVRKLIVPEETALLIKKFGSGKFPAGTHQVIVKNNMVITILDK